MNAKARFVKWIPSLLTVANLVIGVFALVWTYQGDTERAALLVVCGMVLDGLDGRAARWLRAESVFGKELDSLSDLVTFGVAPALIMYNSVLQHEGWLGVCLTALFPCCGALRLARFNAQQRPSHYFVGLPITAAGGILATMSLCGDLLSPAQLVLPAGMLILSLLMVSRARYPNFKRVGFPRSAAVGVPLLALFVIGLFRFDHAVVNRLIFLPLALYAFIGLVQAARRRQAKLRDDADAEPFESGLK
ncbi:MAG: CDP-diacylglycerol--serine O-phosphatidyltransferase [Alicyclobacillaceae bacterium]|nr:CDP-diacylglycerol--serine O-phosphatidyltransferase [Alicyclobacillaceae bacterium]